MPTVFVSYSHLDSKWCDRAYPFALIPWLENALRRDGVTLWYDRSDDTGILPGAEFQAGGGREEDERHGPPNVAGRPAAGDAG